MKKLLAVIVLALVVATAVWVFLRVQLAHRLAQVAELLPATTLAVVQVPDFKKTREQWHGSDLYQIWREPAVQAWLQESLARLPKHRGDRQMLDDFLQLGPTQGFVALTALENNEPKVIGGFHFDESPEAVRTFVEQRKAEWLPQSGAAKRETTVYEQHAIETMSVSHFVFASVYDNHWFFLANDVAALKALLDRVDHRGEKAGASLQTSADFSDAMKHLPSEYAGLLFLDPRPFVEKLLPIVAMTGQALPMDQLQRLKQVRAVASTFGFEHGKMRETDFVAMPRLSAEEKLERRSLAAADANTFFYSATRLHWPENMLAPSAPVAASLPAVLQQLTAALKARGISQTDVREAFGEELEMVGDWPAASRWPVLQVSLPVKDSVRARKIAEALTSVEISGTPWTRSEKNGATIYSAEPFGGFIPLRFGLAVSDQMIIVGSDAAAIEAAISRSGSPAGELEKSAIFQDAAKQVPPGSSAFNYVDTRLLFERADAAVRPLLLMGAALSPKLGKNVDPAKFPPPEAIAKHLSPIVLSQRYDGDGYVTESIGPVPFRGATLGLAGGIFGLFVYFQETLRPSRGTPTPSPTASPF
ncbi:MAG: hypothetical protein ABI217_11430 [Chthoniobacterales bacterium]